MSSRPRLAGSARARFTSRCVAPAIAALLMIAGTSSLADTAAPSATASAPAWGPTGPSIGHDEGREIRAWYAKAENRQAPPPSQPMVQDTGLPVRIRRQIDVNRPLPLEAEPWSSRLPAELEARLPALPTGYQRVIIGRDVFLVETSAANPFSHPNKVRGVVRRVRPQ